MAAWSTVSRAAVHDRDRRGAHDRRSGTRSTWPVRSRVCSRSWTRGEGRRGEARADGVGLRDRDEPCRSTREAGAQLRALRRRVQQVADQRGLAIGSRRGPIRALGGPADRLAPALPELIAGLSSWRRRSSSGSTCTSGSTTPDKAIHVTNGMRVHVPTLLALSANSPFWRGQQTGSSPPARRSSGPSRGWAIRRATRTSRTGAAGSTSWRRVSCPTTPTSGTTCARTRTSAPSRSGSWTPRRAWSTLAIAALIQAMVKELAEHYDVQQVAVALPVRDARREQVAGRPPRPRGRAGRPAGPIGWSPRAGRRLMDRLRPHAEELGSADELRRASRTSSTTARARPGRRSSTRPTTISRRSCARSSRPACPRPPRRPATDPSGRASRATCHSRTCSSSVATAGRR